MEFHPESFVNSLPVLGKGMFAIFLVIGILILGVCLLNAVGNRAGKKK
ncbi:MAG: hypothetical protein J1E00_01340 [Oscillospiraceae bacterium]|nr:hypothetical protein [Oscillospiraceae bacterium]